MAEAEEAYTIFFLIEAPSGQLKFLYDSKQNENSHLEEDNFVHLGGTGSDTRASKLEVEDSVTTVSEAFSTSLKAINVYKA